MNFQNRLCTYHQKVHHEPNLPGLTGRITLSAPPSTAEGYSMDISFLLKGIVMGLSIAAPVGPIGVLCIRRTLAEGRLPGLLTGLGAATADAVYGCVAGFGITVVSSLLISQQTRLGLLGGLFLCYLGVRTLWSKPAEQAAKATSTGLLGSYSSTFLLTLTNPMTIISFAAIFSGLGIVNANQSHLSAAILVLGVFTGSATWWLVLSSLVSLFRARLDNPGALRWINIISGLIILGVGASQLLLLATW
jgi:threonine/homoserine/homoserine lactone efflux protein